MRLSFKKKKGMPVKPKKGRRGMHPTRDWMIGLSGAALILLTGAAAIAYDFRVQFVLPPEAAPNTAAGVTYSERDVLYYAEQFQEKDARFDMLRSGTKDSTSSVEEASSNDDTDLAPQDSDEYTTPALSS
jgi:hypothetical protein